MTTLLLLRHGLTEMTGHTLAGWTPGVHLDERGREQARAVAGRLAPLRLDAIVSSPLERCVETAEEVARGRDVPVQIDDRFGECGYGEWTGRPLTELAKEPLWRVVQAHPSAAVFPGGEAMADVQRRAVRAVREWNERLGPKAVYLVCTHGDVIKAIVADALGLHLDQFQRITVDPASVTAIRYTPLRPFLLRANDIGGGIANLIPPDGEAAQEGEDDAMDSSDAAVGGGAGTA
ncbi:phosphatase [Thermobispora bispora]|uniref:Phosphoglycerate mutase n=1 Tax=Thermobispora bispora (strain ATCC 19993 / DSM 43833 / CBS 139.67 / JCM 10125 / KCTC 9307 / NBRC 14880 / R51) TaxID=469371 RepID=D6Y1P2_THEBD|nr:histidine phosphatase family protein [Thermobispora bispora]MBO2474616.1 phosphoglycerate mutase [Actinomycetales bacterium]MDI9579590.1 histidine phosphatase family protein [Thermobispora sp.]ADG88648.1 Phosphoglycerate mutase [Thermobispora bispora DSM 43833]MBX6167569.1 MSMEG_4193 family putative phosphomutase [Thermobispora bispora]QSI48433.1 MSMEG_4193 family putative phosphomutase [Thermobispora bispora]